MVLLSIKITLIAWGVLPYITYTGMCRPTGSCSWFRKGYPFQRRFLERGIIFRTHESSSFVSNHLKLFKDRLLLKIRFNAFITSKLVYSCCTRERSIKNWPISRTGYQFSGNFVLERGPNLESPAAHTHPKNTRVPPPPLPPRPHWRAVIEQRNEEHGTLGRVGEGLGTRMISMISRWRRQERY